MEAVALVVHLPNGHLGMLVMFLLVILMGWGSGGLSGGDTVQARNACKPGYPGAANLQEVTAGEAF